MTAERPATHDRPPRLDCHIHLVGNGLKGNGCWLKMSGWHRMMGGMMSRMVGMPISFLHEDFDKVYVGRIVEMLRTSSLDQALLLAQDEVYNDDGSKRSFGSFHVPNDYLFSVCEIYPVPVGAWYPWIRGLIDGESRATAARIGNLLERDFFLKQSMGFDESHFTRLGEILRKI